MTTEKGKIARWRKQPNETGLARIRQSSRGYELREGDKRIISVSCAEKRYGHNGMWYWVGLGQNTYGVRMFLTGEEAKADADKAYKEWLKNTTHTG